jgi:hypothetical protein
VECSPLEHDGFPPRILPNYGWSQSMDSPKWLRDFCKSGLLRIHNAKACAPSCDQTTTNPLCSDPIDGICSFSILPYVTGHWSNGLWFSPQLNRRLLFLLLLRFWFLPTWKILQMFKSFDLWTFSCEPDCLGSRLRFWKCYLFSAFGLRMHLSPTQSFCYSLWSVLPWRFQSLMHSLCFWDFVKIRS